MSKKQRYTAGQKEALLREILESGKSVASVSKDSGVPEQTLSKWKQDRERGPHVPTHTANDRQVSYAKRLEILQRMADLEESAQGAYMRESGVTPEQVQQWKDGLSGASTDRQLRRDNRALTKELARKEKALAEAAALLILKKKVETLFTADGDDGI